MCYAGGFSVLPVRTHRSRCNDFFGTTPETLPRQRLGSYATRRTEMAMSVPSPETSWILLVCCFKHEIHLGYFGMMTYDHFRFDGSKFGVIRRMPPFCDRIKGHDFGGVKQLNCQSCVWHVSPIHINTSQYLNIPQYCKRETRLPVSFDLVWPKLLPSYLPRWSLPWQSSTNTALPWQARCLPWQPWWLRPRKLPRCAPWSLQFLRSLRRQPRWIRRAWTWFGAPGCCEAWSRYGYGSIPINAIFRGMNIHLPAILMFTRGTRFWHTAIFFQLLDDM